MHKQHHEIYMRRALQLAKLGIGQVAPNPIVGAVLVHDGQITGEGFHQKYGEAHAEVHCINDALKHGAGKITSSTLYVSLEPCAHYGKTPPCADLIIHHKIPQVVIGCRDSFDKVNGKGIEKLQAAGIKVITGILEKEAVASNKAFFTFHQHQRPYIILKWAQTADGFIAGNSNERLMISNDYTNRLVHQWRSETAAIIVGANTAIKDDPLLDNRFWPGPLPKKLLLDPHLKVPDSLRLFKQEGEVVVLNQIKEAHNGKITYVKIDENNVVNDILKKLYHLQIQSVLVEGGRQLLQSFIDAGSWDEARVITNKGLWIENGLPAPQLFNRAKLTETRLFNDEITYFKNKNNAFIHAAAGLF